MDVKVKFGLHEYREAKKIIADAEIVNQYTDPTVKVTTYKTKDGRLWIEHEGRLEYPENHYSLVEKEA